MKGLHVTLIACVAVSLSLGLVTVSATAAPFVADGNQDVGNPPDDPAIPGSYTLVGTTYTLTGGGSDWWDSGEHGYIVYKQLTGVTSWRIQATVAYVGNPPDDWTKAGVFVRNDLSIGPGVGLERQVNAISVATSANGAAFQWRDWPSWNMGNTKTGGARPVKVALQEETVLGRPYVTAFYDVGSGWQKTGSSRFMDGLAASPFVGLMVTAHNNVFQAATATFDDVQLVAPVATYTIVPGAAKLSGDLNNLRDKGIKIFVAKPRVEADWGYNQMNEVLDNPAAQAWTATRIERVVNLHDSGGRGRFTNDQSYPGIDTFEQPTADPAAGDEDSNFATRASGYIALTAGVHCIGVDCDDGTIIKIGGVEIGRTLEWKGPGTDDFLFTIEERGIYTFEASNLQGTGGAEFELHNADGTRILLNDNDGPDMQIGQSIIPEPATLTLISLGGLAALIRRRPR